MGIYRAIWRTLLGLLAGSGCVVAIFGVSVGTIVASGLAAAVISAAIVISRREEHRRPIRDAVRNAMIAASCAVGFIGISKEVGGVGLVVAAVLFVSSPWLVLRLRRRVRLGRPEAKLADPSHLPDRPVDELTDRQLCVAWTCSHELWRNSLKPAERSELAARRQSYLDELERRHPAEFACWLYNHPGPGDDPGPFLAAPR